MIWSMHDDDACQEKSHFTKLLRAKSCWKDCTRHLLRLYDYTAKWFLKIISISGRLKWDENYVSVFMILSLEALALQSFYESTMRQTQQAFYWDDATMWSLGFWTSTSHWEINVSVNMTVNASVSKSKNQLCVHSFARTLSPEGS